MRWALLVSKWLGRTRLRYVFYMAFYVPLSFCNEGLLYSCDSFLSFFCMLPCTSMLVDGGAFWLEICDIVGRVWVGGFMDVGV